MKCPSCGYVSFDNPTACKKCGAVLKTAGEEETIFTFDEEYLSDQEAAPPEDGIREAGWRVIQEPSSSPPVPQPPAKAPERAEAETAPRATSTHEPAKKPVRRPAPRKVAPPPPAPSPQAPPVPPPAPTPEAVAAPAPPAAGEPIFDDLFNFEEMPAAAPPAAEPPLLAFVAEAEPLLEDFRIDLEAPVFLDPPDIGPPSGPEPAPIVAPKGATPEEGILPLRHPNEVPEAFWGEKPAGFGRRAGAFFFDQVVVAFLVGLFVAGAGVELALSGVSTVWLATHFWPGDVLLPFFLLAALISATYFISSQWLQESTPGMRRYGLKVVGREGQRLTLADAFFRWLGYLVSAAPLGIGFWWARWDRGRLAWHDRLSGTLVVSATEAADKSA